MMGARGMGSPKTLLHFILMLWTMAFSAVQIPMVTKGLILVSSSV